MVLIVEFCDGDISVECFADCQELEDLANASIDKAALYDILGTRIINLASQQATWVLTDINIT